MTLDLGDLCFEGTHVRLRGLVPGDAEALAAAAGESREHYGYVKVPDGLAAAEAYISSALASRVAGVRHPFAIEWKGRVVGSTSYYEYQPWRWPDGCELARVDRPDALEIGYTFLAASAQRTVCNTEAKRLLLGHAFDSWHVHRVAFRTDVRNARSRGAIERLGARFDGIRRADRPGADCTVRDSASFTILAGEWPDVRAHLDRLLARRG